MGQPRVFLSYSSKDATFAERLEADLQAAGANVYRVSADQPGNFQERIDAALLACEWVVLVLTKDALASPWVRQEVYAANRLKNRGRIKELLPIRAGPTNDDEIPPSWGVYNIFDATDKLLRALGLVAAVSPADAVPPADGARPVRLGKPRIVRPETVPIFASAELTQAIALMRREQYGKALAGFDRALAIYPTYEKAWVGRGMALHGLRTISRSNNRLRSRAVPGPQLVLLP